VHHLKRSKNLHIQNEGYLFILPVFIFFLIYSVYPLVFNICCAFLDWNGMSANFTFVGIDNFIKLIKDPVLLIIFRNTGLYFIGTILPQAIFGLILAYIVTRRVRWPNFFRAYLYFPSIIPLTIVCITFTKIFETQSGYLNNFFHAIGLGFLSQQWLARPGWALFSLITINVWTYISFSMYLYCVSMTNIPDELYEASTIDGANGFQQFFHITFPLLGNTHMTLILLGFISVVKNFDIPFIVTGGGPARSTEFFATYMYEIAFDKFDQGRASALICIMLVICLVMTIFQLKMYKVQLKKNGV